jgi:hypothetical protein
MGKDRTENTAPILLRVFVSAETCLFNSSLATAVGVTSRMVTIPSTVAWGHYLATAVSLSPQFLLWANTTQYRRMTRWQWTLNWKRSSCSCVNSEALVKGRQCWAENIYECAASPDDNVHRYVNTKKLLDSAFTYDKTDLGEDAQGNFLPSGCLLKVWRTLRHILYRA